MIIYNVFKICSISRFTYIPLMTIVLVLYIINTKYQPFYDIRVNAFRNGIFGILIFIGIFSIIQSAISSKSIFMLIGSIILGILGFFVGVSISIKYFKKCNENIYLKYKIALDVNDPDMVSSDDEENNSEKESDDIIEEEDEEEEEEEESRTSSSQSQQSPEEESKNSNEDDENESNSNSNSQDESEHSGSSSSNNNDFTGDEELALFNSIYEI
eukprot:jgi/Orpsp1_1/1178637/evm.model.c7180000066175.2